jgi:hypothetical protein
MVMNELEKEIKRLRVVLLEALDNNNDTTADFYIDEISLLAKILNSGMSKAEYQVWLTSNEHMRENNPLPAEIEDEVLSAIENSNLNKEMVERWNEHLPFNLHEKLNTYGFVGSARLNKIFAV